MKHKEKSEAVINEVLEELKKEGIVIDEDVLQSVVFAQARGIRYCIESLIPVRLLYVGSLKLKEGVIVQGDKPLENFEKRKAIRGTKPIKALEEKGSSNIWKNFRDRLDSQKTNTDKGKEIYKPKQVGDFMNAHINRSKLQQAQHKKE